MIRLVVSNFGCKVVVNEVGAELIGHLCVTSKVSDGLMEMNRCYGSRVVVHRCSS